MADVTTHGNTVRADRMELLTTSERIPERVRRLENVVAGGGAQILDPWHRVGTAGEPGFQNGWANYGGPFQVARFRKDPFGRVFVEGLVAGGTNGTPVFTLPAGYRPPNYLIYACDTQANAHARVDVYSDGGLIPSSANAAYLSLSNIRFDTDSVSTYLPGQPGASGPAGPAGPVGPGGPPGPIGPGGTMEYYAQTGQPATTNNGAIWIDTDASPGFVVTEPEPWREIGAANQPSFQNGWNNYPSSTFQSAAFYKDPLGVVHLKGLISGGTVGQPGFTLPVGYRPPKYIHCAIASNDLYGTLRIDGVSGAVQIGGPAAAAWVSLDCVTFRAA